MENVVIPEFYTGWATLLWVLVTVLMPLVVGLVTRPSTPAKVQAVLLIVLAAVNGFLSEALEKGSAYNWTDGTLQFVVSLVIAIAIHYGVWKPTLITRRVLDIGAGATEKRVSR